MNQVHLEAAIHLGQDVIVQVDDRAQLREARAFMYSQLGQPTAAMFNRYRYEDRWIEFVNLEAQPGYESPKAIFYVGEKYPEHMTPDEVGQAMGHAIRNYNEAKGDSHGEETSRANREEDGEAEASQ